MELSCDLLGSSTTSAPRHCAMSQSSMVHKSSTVKITSAFLFKTSQLFVCNLQPRAFSLRIYILELRSSIRMSMGSKSARLEDQGRDIRLIDWIGFGISNLCS